jgi:hypothetical protein
MTASRPFFDLTNSEGYAAARAAYSGIAFPASTPESEARSYVTQKLAEELANVRGSKLAAGIKEGALKEKIDEAYQIYLSELSRAGVNEHSPLLVVQDSTLPAGKCMVRGISRVVTVNTKDDTISTAELAHEFGHAGAKVTYGPSPRGLEIIHGSLRYRNQAGVLVFDLIEELAAMTYFMAATFKDNSTPLAERVIVLNLDKPLSGYIRSLFPLMVEVADPQGFRNANAIQSSNWIENYVQQRCERGQQRFEFPFSGYKFPEGVRSAYEAACSCMDILGQELFPNEGPAQAAMSFRRRLQRAQAKGEPGPITQLFSERFGANGLRFLENLCGYNGLNADQAGAQGVLSLILFTSSITVREKLYEGVNG